MDPYRSLQADVPSGDKINHNHIDIVSTPKKSSKSAHNILGGGPFFNILGGAISQQSPHRLFKNYVTIFYFGSRTSFSSKCAYNTARNFGALLPEMGLYWLIQLISWNTRKSYLADFGLVGVDYIFEIFMYDIWGFAHRKLKGSYRKDTYNSTKEGLKSDCR